MPHEFIAQELLILMSAVWIFGKIFRVLRLPGIFGELMAGIIVGPVILNAVWESEGITMLAELGIFFLMLHAGLETDPKDFLKAVKKFFPIALGGSLLPLFGGWLIGTLFGYTFLQSLFIGMGLSITAMAVSVRLFKDCRVSNSPVAHVTMGAALMSDIFALIIFSIVQSIGTGAAGESVDIFLIPLLVLKMFIFFGGVLFLGDKLFKHLSKIMYSGNKGFTFTVIVALSLGVIAEAIGLHIIIGAFLAGLFIREEIVEEKVFFKIEDRIFGLSYSFLGPIFIATLAFNLDFTIFKENPLFLGVLFLVAVLGKVLGAGIPAYFLGMTKNESLGVGLAMNSRGAVELIIANEGLKAGIINEEIFSALVVVAFATTLFSIVTFKPVSRFFAKEERAMNVSDADSSSEMEAESSF